MLAKLSIQNYALIDYLKVDFSNGFTVITGETGAGKSILLGGLSLVLGKRADLSSLRDKDQKCIVEADFQVDKFGLKTFFEENDLDYEANTILRREILPSGKSRAFINDSPVTLDILSSLGNRLIDVHSQHQTLQLADNDFQLMVIDALAGNKSLLTEYTHTLASYNKMVRELNALIENKESASRELDYNSFLLDELEKAALKNGAQEELEEKQEQLSNVETILDQLSKGHQLLRDEQIGILGLLSELKQASMRLSGYGNQYSALNDRILSVGIEVDDIADEWQSLEEGIDADPNLLEEVNGKLQSIYNLQKKHNATTISELLEIKEILAEKVGITQNLESTIAKKEKEKLDLETKLGQLSVSIRMARNKVIPSLKEQLEESLSALGMPNSRFKIEVDPSKEFRSSGMDDLSFLFSANKGTEFGELKKVASGGELSRIMLTIKAILGNYENLPTIMFDEIDTGVSGEISNKMGDIMLQMSKTMQVFSITHLPQVASKGNHHFKVFKDDRTDVTHTRMKKLDVEERVLELAEMLGGKNLTDSAMAHARQLLN